MLILERGPQWGKPLWVILSLGAFDMGPVILILEIFVVSVSSPTLDSYPTYFPQFWPCYTLLFFPESVSPKASKWLTTYPYISMYSCPCPLPMHTLTPIQWSHYLTFLLRTWQRIKMVWKLAHKVKFEGDQGDWIPGLIARRLYNANTCTLHF